MTKASPISESQAAEAQAILARYQEEQTKAKNAEQEARYKNIREITDRPSWKKDFEDLQALLPEYASDPLIGAHIGALVSIQPRLASSIPSPVVSLAPTFVPPVPTPSPSEPE